VGPLRLLVVSDIHSNLPALERVLEDAGVFDGAICAGDVVGYGPDPAKCIEGLSGRNVTCVTGNHDQAAVTGDSSNLNEYAAEAIRINRRLLINSHVEWLRSLQSSLSLEVEGVRISVFHGSPYQPLVDYIYPEEARQMAGGFFDDTGSDLLILGHTHVPYIYRFHEHVLLNPGSVGQPRDGDPRSSYMLVDVAEGKIDVSHERVSYDIVEVASRMRQLGLPEMLSIRLFNGW